MPTFTVLGPILTIVSVTSSPIKIRSPDFLESTNILFFPHVLCSCQYALGEERFITKTPFFPTDPTNVGNTLIKRCCHQDNTLQPKGLASRPQTRSFATQSM